jgi:DNA repair protein SbcC/Rad50
MNMLPITLKLKNFLAYRDPDPLYFDGITLACLTGANGAGKSSLLDAITWVLWGKARAKSDNELIHSGQNDMSVELEFEHADQRYKVIRTRSAGKSGKSALNFLSVKRDGSLQTLDEPNLRETQKRIIDLLRLEYDTFVTSAFLQQGKADAFTTKQPAERKRLLADILGLEQWEVYEQRTKDQLKEIDRTLENLKGSLKEIQEELRFESSYQATLRTAKQNRDDAQKELEIAEARVKEFANAETDYKLMVAQIQDLQKVLRERQADRDTVYKDGEKLTQQLADYQAILEQSEAIRTGLDILREAREQDGTLGEQLSQVRELEKHKNTLEKHIQSERTTLEKQLSALFATIQQLRASASIDNTAHLLTLREKIAELQQAENERTYIKHTESELKEERGQLSSQMNSLKEQGDELKERIKTLEEAEGATCPLCGQPLTEEHRTTLGAELGIQLAKMRDDWASANTRSKDIDKEIKDSTKRFDDLSQALQDLPRLQKDLGKLEKEQTDAQANQTKLMTQEAEYTTLQKRLEEHDYAHTEQHELQQLSAELDHIGYSEQTHSDIRQKLSEYSAYEKQSQRLHEAEVQIPSLTSQLEEKSARYERLNKAIEADEVTLEENHQQLPQLEANVLEHKRLTQARNEQQQKHTRAMGEVQVAEQQLKALDARRERAKKIEMDQENLSVEAAYYEELKLAFGKNGVPAMIIESAIPELEMLANDLLTRMTNGRMHLRLTTQQEKQDGGLKETLNIEIADELGTRSYEMYSGGEAFRVNFALRIALSKLLARRAGAQLSTLFIDEGFGTQDEEGRGKLVDAINTVQEDFKMILVITHMEDLRDSFPVHITIEKTPRGSRVSIQ